MSRYVKQPSILLWGFAFLLLILIVSVFHIFSIRLNVTGSMPVGLYQKLFSETMQHSDLVAICLPTAVASAGKVNGYIGSGSCPNNSTPLLKKVVAIPGDTVVLSQQSIQVNDIVYYAPQQKFDHNHKPIQHWIIAISY